MKMKHIFLSWLLFFRLLLSGVLLYLPTYLFYTLTLWGGIHLFFSRNDITYWQCLGLLLLIRVIKTIWNIHGDEHHKSGPTIQKEPYQIPAHRLPPGFCWLGDQLLMKTSSGALLDASTGTLLSTRLSHDIPLNPSHPYYDLFATNKDNKSATD